MLPGSKARAMLFYVDLFIHWKCKVIKTSSVKLLFPCLFWINSIWCQNGIKIQAVMFSNCVLIHLHKASPSGTNCFSQWIIYIFLFPYKHFPLWIIYVFFFFSFTCFFLHSSSPPCGWGELKYWMGKKDYLMLCFVKNMIYRYSKTRLKQKDRDERI